MIPLIVITSSILIVPRMSGERSWNISKNDLVCIPSVREWVKRRRRRVTISRAVKKPGAFALDIEPVN